MSAANFIIFYVDHPAISAEFYAELLGKPAIEASLSFALFALASGAMLGLWARDGVEPTATAHAGATELAFSVGDKHLVDTMYADWSNRGLRMVQTPTTLDFGYTFVALDPDGHRLRVFAASA